MRYGVSGSCGAAFDKRAHGDPALAGQNSLPASQSAIFAMAANAFYVPVGNADDVDDVMEDDPSFIPGGKQIS
jgi:hypothetical protein